MHPRTDATMSFKYPDDRLLKLRAPIQEDKMCNPDMFDDDGEPCLLVIKNGNSTGVTIGRATGIFSFVRQYFSNATHQTSMEWAILPYDNKSGVFSAPTIRVLSSLTAADVLAASSPAVPARRSPRASRTRRPSSGSYRASGTMGFLTPTSTRSWPRRRNIEQNDTGDSGKAVRG